MAGLCVLRIEIMNYIRVAELYLTFKQEVRAQSAWRVGLRPLGVVRC